MASVQDINNEIDRIENAKSGIAEAIEEKGVQVPAGTPIQDFPAKVRQIQQGSPDAVLYTPQELTSEQQAQARQNIGAGTYTKPNTGIPATDFAQGVQTSLEKANTAVQPSALTPITDLIPEQATPQNQLADKNFVNSSVATNTANYISDNGQPFQSVADLEAYTGTLTNNDYAFVVGTDSAGNTTYTRYKYNATTQTWAAEYVLNNSSFTAAQWAAISSGITALLVQKLSDLPTEIVTYVAQTLTDAQKQQARTNIGATAPEIFVCTYGVTTFDEVKAAYHAGKLCVCDRNGNYYVFAIWQGDDAPCYFSCGMTGRIFYLRLHPNNSWFNSSYVFEQKSNMSQSVPDDRANETKYPSVKAVFDSLGKWGVVSQTINWTGNANDGYEASVSDPVMGLIPQVFIDSVVAQGATFNETTGYFELNGINNIAYDEMRVIDAKKTGIGQTWVGSIYFGLTYKARTNFAVFRDFSLSYSNHPPVVMKVKYMGVGANVGGVNSNLIVLALHNYDGILYGAAGGEFGNCFSGNRTLKTILGIFNVTNGGTLFYPNAVCPKLETFYMRSLAANLSLTGMPSLLVPTIAYIVQYANNSNAITITLHATAYARCQADTTEYTYNGQTYTGIIAYAAAKNITIASA